MNRKFGKNDILLLTAIVIVSIGLLIVMTFAMHSGNQVLVTVDGKVYGTYLLSENQKIEIQIDGQVTNILSIQDGKADMTEANCQDRLCVHQKAISKDKESIVCLPNKVVVTVESKNQNEFDSMAR